jgi:short-subunit dehydrogenase
VGVTAVFPGGIRTAIAKNSRRGTGVSDDEWDFGQAMFEKFLVIEPSTAARRIVAGTIRRKARVLIGPETYVGDAVARLAPAASTRIFEELMRLKARL